MVDKEKIVVRLGEAPKQMKKIADDAMDRGVAAMKLFAHVAERYRAPIRAVATSATREAENGRDFIERVAEETGIEIEVVSGIEEARLIYLGVIQALPIVDRTVALFDIGGGSTEILVGSEGSPLWANSFKIGAIRMTQRFFPDETVTEEQIQRLRLYLRGELYFAGREVRSRRPDLLVASSGTALTIASMALQAAGRTVPEPLNNVTISLDEVRDVVRRVLDAPTFDDRAAIPGCDPRRSDILAAGGVILETCMEELGFEEITTSSYAMREGIIFDTIRTGRDGGTSATATALTDLRLESVVKLGRTYDFDEPHARNTARLAVLLFDRLSELHKLSGESRELLEAAALLHDIGYYIGPSSHHKHSLYLIANSSMLGFHREELDVMANIARYHRKSYPKMRHEPFSALPDEERDRIPTLAGILRIADSLDRTHRGMVVDITVKAGKKRLLIEPIGKDGADIAFECWSAARRTGLLESALDREIKIVGDNVPQ